MAAYMSVRQSGVVFPGGIDVANQSEPVSKTVAILGQHVVPGCLPACERNLRCDSASRLIRPAFGFYGFVH